MCLSPVTVVLPSFPSGRKVVSVPCGHCLECLRKKQNDIMIRCIEESKNWPRLVFVTLTYSEESLHRASTSVHREIITVPCGDTDEDTGETPIQQFYDCSDASYEFLCKTNGVFGVVSHEDIQAWLKRNRERYVVRKSKELGIPRKAVERIRMKYFFTTEYGPNTLRPHAHGIIWFDCPKSVICSFLRDWSDNIGYVNYTFIDTPALSTEHIENISRYVSKYCSKGVFESPLVKDGIAPKCSKLYSKGLGASYVEHKRSYHLCEDLGVFPGQSLFYGSFAIPCASRVSRYGKRSNFLNYVKLFNTTVNNYLGSLNLVSLDSPLEDVKSLHLLQRYSYTLVSHGQCFSYALPRYYRDKIYGAKSLLSRTLSATLAENFLKDCRERERAYINAHPNATDFEVSLALSRQDDIQRVDRANDWYKRTLKHYKKSFC